MTQPLADADLAALIGLLSVLEAHLMGGGIDPYVASSFADRLHRDGLTESADPGVPLRHGINDLNHRIRSALGDYEVAPDSVSFPE